MKTQKELLKEIKSLQGELQTITTLCEFIPEKLAVHFKPAYLRSGYSMGETIVYTCNGKTIITQNECKHYTGTGRKYTPTHGYIKVEFNKKNLKTYCTLLQALSSIDWFTNLDRVTITNLNRDIEFRKKHNMNAVDLERDLEVKKASLRNRYAKADEKIREMKELVKSCIKFEESKIKDLFCII